MRGRREQFRALYLDQRISHQASYYSDRADEYGRAHHQAVVLRNVLLLLAAVAGALGQAPVGGPTRAGLAVAAAVFGALAGAVTAYDALIGFPQLEKLYRDAGYNLAEAALDWEDADADVAAEVERVEFVFRSERGQWGQLVVRSARATEQEEPDDDPDGGGTAPAPPPAVAP